MREENRSVNGYYCKQTLIMRDYYSDVIKNAAKCARKPMNYKINVKNTAPLFRFMSCIKRLHKSVLLVFRFRTIK